MGLSCYLRFIAYFLTGFILLSGIGDGHQTMTYQMGKLGNTYSYIEEEHTKHQAKQVQVLPVLVPSTGDGKTSGRWETV